MTGADDAASPAASATAERFAPHVGLGLGLGRGHRWRETFADRLREWDVDAEGTRQASRGEHRNRDELWRIKAREQGRLRKDRH